MTKFHNAARLALAAATMMGLGACTYNSRPEHATTTEQTTTRQAMPLTTPMGTSTTTTTRQQLVP